MKNPHQKSGDLSGDSKGKHHSHKAVYAKKLILAHEHIAGTPDALDEPRGFAVVVDLVAES